MQGLVCKNSSVSKTISHYKAHRAGTRACANMMVSPEAWIGILQEHLVNTTTGGVNKQHNAIQLTTKSK